MTMKELAERDGRDALTPGPIQTFAEEYLPSGIQETPEWQRVVESNLLLVEAAERALNYIANTESELGIELTSGRVLRLALAKARTSQEPTQ